MDFNPLKTILFSCLMIMTPDFTFLMIFDALNPNLNAELFYHAIQCKEMDKSEVDKVIEDEITQKLSEDLLQSIEKKFHVDLEKAVDSVLSKIKLLLQNGTTHIQEKLGELTTVMDNLKKVSPGSVDHCLIHYQNETTALAEKALHQMVVCGYALIGHDPAQAIRSVMELKAMIKLGLKPIYNNKEEVYKLLRVCGHDHESLKKVIKCVISKSPQLKSAMMTVSGKLIDGIVHLTKQMAHGAMHEACLIEVINTVEDEAFVITDKVRKCSSNETIDIEMRALLKDNNATVLDVDKTEKLKKEGARNSLDEVAQPVKNLKNMMDDSISKVYKSVDRSTKDLMKPDHDAGDTNVITH